MKYYNSALMIYCIYMQNIQREEGFVGISNIRYNI